MHHAAVRLADQLVVGQRAAVGMERCPGGQGDQVLAALRVGELDLVPGAERAAALTVAALTVHARQGSGAAVAPPAAVSRGRTRDPDPGPRARRIPCRTAPRGGTPRPATCVPPP